MSLIESPCRKSTRAIVILLFPLILAVTAGCPSGSQSVPASPSPPTGPPRTLQVLVIDDEQLAEAVERQWQARSETPIALRRSTTTEALDAGDELWSADVVIFPSGLLGECAERERIVPLSQRQLDSPEFNRQDVFEALRRGETMWGQETYAVSLGSPQLTLMYRHDIFESLKLVPPTTWDEYRHLVDHLGNRDALATLAPPVDVPWQATREPVGDGWAGQLLLARAAAYVRHPHQYSSLFDLRDMRPLVDGVPFVRALEELVEATPDAADAQAVSPGQARADLLAGHCAMALTWPSQTASPGDATPAGMQQFGFAALPGSSEVYNHRNQEWEPHADDKVMAVPLLASAGRLVALTRNGRRSAAANTMLLWLGGIELGNLVSPASESTTLFRDSQIAAAGRWMNSQVGDPAARQYGELVRDTQNQSVWLRSVSIPGRPRYLAALDQAVQRALNGEPPQKVLTEAAVQWEKITDELGRDKQKAAYTRSIGLEP